MTIEIKNELTTSILFSELDLYEVFAWLTLPNMLCIKSSYNHYMYFNHGSKKVYVANVGLDGGQIHRVKILSIKAVIDE